MFSAYDKKLKKLNYCKTTISAELRLESLIKWSLSSALHFD